MYLDTAILLKLFVREPDSEFFGKLVNGQSISSSALALTEIFSALLGKERAGSITSTQRQRAWSAFHYNVDEELIELTPISPSILRRANRILERCHPSVPLRSLDALHLATCDQLQDWPLYTTDKRMRQAADVMGFPLNETPGDG
jgi:predicted nucleic acid-binding protein